MRSSTDALDSKFRTNGNYFKNQDKQLQREQLWRAFDDRTVICRRQLMQLSTDCLMADFETGSVNSGSYQYPLTEN